MFILKFTLKAASGGYCLCFPNYLNVFKYWITQRILFIIETEDQSGNT